MPKTHTADTVMHTGGKGSFSEQMPIQKIDQPGCYVDGNHGYLYRVTPEMLSIGGTVFLGFTSSEPWNVSRISNDPNTPLDECRIIAANYSLDVNF